MIDNQSAELKEQIRMRELRERQSQNKAVPLVPVPHIPEPSDLAKLQEVLDDIGIEYDTEPDDFGTLLQIGTSCFNSAFDSLEFDGDGFYIG